MDSIRIQYMSDLHLEMFPGFRINKVNAEYLVLAGDIGDPESVEYSEFIADCTTKFKHVFVILGNHEAYGKPSWAYTQQVARKIVESKGAIFLDNDTVDLIDGKLRIIGTTLWSNVHGPGANDVRTFIADYRRIGGMKCVADSNEMHDLDVAWLRAELALSDVPTIVVTHHAPSLYKTSHPKNESSSLNSAFATDLLYMMKRPVVAWIFGHTHFSGSQTVGDNVVLMSNQRGYADNPSETDMFNEGKVISIPI